MIKCAHSKRNMVPRSLTYVQVSRIKAGRIGKRVRIPRGRATVNDFADCRAKPKVRRPARTLQQLLNAREKVFRSQWEFLLFRKLSRRQPVASRGRRGDGILNFKLQQKRPKAFASIS